MVSHNDFQTVVRVDGFAKRYGRTCAVEDVSLQVRHGEIYGLIGPDGAGKSSLMKAIAGVLSYDQGTVRVFDTLVDSERSAERIKGRIAFMPQGLGLNLYPELSIEENIDFFASLRRVPARALAGRKTRLLEKTRLVSFRDRPMKLLSGGMKQKLGLVCSLIHAPDLVILDEPTTGVDPVSRRDFWAMVNEMLREEGITALVSTAYMDEAARFHRVGLMHQGRLLATGEPDEILAQAPGTVVGLRTADDPRAIGLLRARFSQVTAHGSWVHVFAEGTDRAAAIGRVTETLGSLAVYQLHVEEPELEDVFVAILDRQQPQHPRQAPPRSVSGRRAERSIEARTDTGTDATAGLPDIAVSSDASHCWTSQQGPPRYTVHMELNRAEEAAIEAESLSRQFGAFRAVDEVSFRVRPGELFGLLGANGAGKTTVIKMLTGILPPTSGKGHVAGAEMRHAGRAIRERIGYMSQAFSLYQDLTALENIRLYAGIYGLSRAATRSRVDWVLQMAGLAGYERQRAGRLPVGLRQRLALGCALVHHPRVLFLDEPTSGVDPTGRRAFWDILFGLSRTEGVAILVTTHYMSEAEHCDHLALMHAGRIVSDATPSQMKQEVEAEAGRLLAIRTDQPLAAAELLRGAGFPEASLFGRGIHLLAHDPSAAEVVIRSVLAAAGVRVLGVETRPLSMEDVFVHRVLRLESQGEAAP